MWIVMRLFNIGLWLPTTTIVWTPPILSKVVLFLFKNNWIFILSVWNCNVFVVVDNRKSMNHLHCRSASLPKRMSGILVQILQGRCYCFFIVLRLQVLNTKWRMSYLSNKYSPFPLHVESFTDILYCHSPSWLDLFSSAPSRVILHQQFIIAPVRYPEEFFQWSY